MSKLLGYQVRSARLTNFRRCGIDFNNRDTTFVALDRLTEQQRAHLEGSDQRRELVVEKVFEQTPPTPPSTKPKK